MRLKIFVFIIFISGTLFLLKCKTGASQIDDLGITVRVAEQTDTLRLWKECKSVGDIERIYYLNKMRDKALKLNANYVQILQETVSASTTSAGNTTITTTIKGRDVRFWKCPKK